MDIRRYLPKKEDDATVKEDVAKAVDSKIVSKPKGNNKNVGYLYSELKNEAVRDFVSGQTWVLFTILMFLLWAVIAGIFGHEWIFFGITILIIIGVTVYVAWEHVSGYKLNVWQKKYKIIYENKSLFSNKTNKEVLKIASKMLDNWYKIRKQLKGSYSSYNSMDKQLERLIAKTKELNLLYNIKTDYVAEYKTIILPYLNLIQTFIKVKNAKLDVLNEEHLDMKLRKYDDDITKLYAEVCKKLETLATTISEDDSAYDYSKANKELSKLDVLLYDVVEPSEEDEVETKQVNTIKFEKLDE